MKPSKLFSNPAFLLAAAVLALLAAPSGAAEPAATSPACAPAPSSLQGGPWPADVDLEPENRIVNGPCSWCTENSSCSTPCIDENENQSTCGDAGVCDQCREALVEIYRVQIGQEARQYYVGDIYKCEYKWHYLVTYQSLNSSSCQTYTYCETETDTDSFNFDPNCCAVLSGGCWGDSC